MNSSVSFPVVALQDLRLGMAHALLGAEVCATLPAPQVHATAYLQAVVDGLCELSQRDSLTETANRRHLLLVLERELDRVLRSGDAALLLMVDVDHFKKVNDRYGHVAGDVVLHQVAQRLAECIRPMDTLARYGGEEFAIVLPACPISYGRAVAERVRQAVESCLISVSATEQIYVTVSVGGAYALQWIRSTSELWIERADLQLYRAKREGRNCVRIEQQPESAVSAEEKALLLGHMPPYMDAVADDCCEPISRPTHPTGNV